MFCTEIWDEFEICLFIPKWTKIQVDKNNACSLSDSRWLIWESRNVAVHKGISAQLSISDTHLQVRQYSRFPTAVQIFVFATLFIKQYQIQKLLRVINTHSFNRWFTVHLCHSGLAHCW